MPLPDFRMGAATCLKLKWKCCGKKNLNNLLQSLVPYSACGDLTVLLWSAFLAMAPCESHLPPTDCTRPCGTAGGSWDAKSPLPTEVRRHGMVAPHPPMLLHDMMITNLFIGSTMSGGHVCLLAASTSYTARGCTHTADESLLQDVSAAWHRFCVAVYPHP